MLYIYTYIHDIRTHTCTLHIQHICVFVWQQPICVQFHADQAQLYELGAPNKACLCVQFLGTYRGLSTDGDIGSVAVVTAFLLMRCLWVADILNVYAARMQAASRNSCSWMEALHYFGVPTFCPCLAVQPTLRPDGPQVHMHTGITLRFFTDSICRSPTVLRWSPRWLSWQPCCLLG